MVFRFGFLWCFVLVFCDNIILSHQDYIIVRYTFLTSRSVVKKNLTTEIALIHVGPHELCFLLFNFRRLVPKWNQLKSHRFSKAFLSVILSPRLSTCSILEHVLFLIIHRLYHFQVFGNSGTQSHSQSESQVSSGGYNYFLFIYKVVAPKIISMSIFLILFSKMR